MSQSKIEFDTLQGTTTVFKVAGGTRTCIGIIKPERDQFDDIVGYLAKDSRSSLGNWHQFKTLPAAKKSFR